MFDTLEPTSSEVYEHAVEPISRGRLHSLTLGVLDLWCAMSGGRFELSSTGRVVVRERLSGLEVLRFPEENPEQLAATLDLVAEQLASMDPEEFRAQWALPV